MSALLHQFISFWKSQLSVGAEGFGQSNVLTYIQMSVMPEPKLMHYLILFASCLFSSPVWWTMTVQAATSSSRYCSAGITSTLHICTQTPHSSAICHPFISPLTSEPTAKNTPIQRSSMDVADWHLPLKAQLKGVYVFWSVILRSQWYIYCINQNLATDPAIISRNSNLSDPSPFLCLTPWVRANNINRERLWL